MTDTRLQSDIESARIRTLAWYPSLQADGLPRGVTKISALHDPVLWPGVLLPGTYNAVMGLDLLGGLDRYLGSHRRALIDWLLGHRLPDGIFRVPGMSNETVFKKPDLTETWRYIDFHTTNYSLGALQALAPQMVPVWRFAEPWLEPLFLKSWLAERDLRDPWLEGNNIVNLGSFLLLMRQHGKACVRGRADAALELMFAWQERLQEPSTGFWGVGQASDATRLLHAMAGSMHNYHLWYATDRPLPHQEAAVDYALSRPAVIDSACIDVDLVDLLVHADGLIGHRRGQTRQWLRAMLRQLLALQGDDGGFVDTHSGTRCQDGWIKGYQEPQGHSNTFATWFRWIAIAMIAECLWPGWKVWNFRSMAGLGYKKRLGSP